MPFRIIVRMTVTALVLQGLSLSLHAQAGQNSSAPSTDSLFRLDKPLKLLDKTNPKPFFQRKLVRASAVPVLLIGLGITTIKGNGMYSSYEAKEEIEEHLGGWHTRADDLLQFAPYVGLATASMFSFQMRDDRLNTLLLIAKSEAIMMASVHMTKRLTNVDRPNGQAYAFPSGHTAQAFLAASIVHTEMRYKSPWYGVGAYTMATSVGVLRMINNKHWEADVLAGAGFGIFSAHLAYLTHSHRWGRKPTLVGLNVTPAYFSGGTPGLTLSWHPVDAR